MNEYQQEQVLSFCDMCGCDFDIATDYLRCCDWSVETAVSMFFENGGAPLSVSNQSVQEEVVSEKQQNYPDLCPHCAGNIKPLTSSTLVYKEECVYCFNNWSDEKGIDICLSCYLGFCSANQHTSLHYQKSRHPMYLRIHRKEIPSEGTESPSKITKLAIGMEGGYMEKEKNYETNFSIHCEACNTEFPVDGAFNELAETLLHRTSGEREKELCAWEAENLLPCPHCTAFHLPNPVPSVRTEDMHCADCELRTNLWLCLECGAFHCGRKQWEGSGLPGNGHALSHYQSTGHSLSVKLASLDESHADVHCYSCDSDASRNYGDVRLDCVMEVLEKMGVVKEGKVVGLAAEQKERNLTALNLRVNSEFDFSMTNEKGEEFLEFSGKACGLENLGNSCYLNAVVQVLLHCASLQHMLDSDTMKRHFEECSRSPVECLVCQVLKIYRHMLLGGKGRTVSTRMLKQAFVQRAKQFDNNQQQDCFEFLAAFVEQMDFYMASHECENMLRLPLRYVMKCQSCGKVDQSSFDEEKCITVQMGDAEPTATLSLQQLIHQCLEGEAIERDCDCCGKKSVWKRCVVYQDFPPLLCVRVNRFIVDYTTFTIKKNTAAISPEDEIEVPRCFDSSIKEGKQKYRLFAACLHRGVKTDCGHYVAVYKDGETPDWILCNDSKVVIAPDAPVKESYLVFYEKE